MCLSTQQHGVDEHKLQAAPAAQGHRLGVVKGREEPPLGQLGVGHLCRRVSIVVMVPGYGIPPVLQGGCREHVLQLEGMCVQGRRRIGGVRRGRCVQLSRVCSTSNVSLNLGSYTSLTPLS